jgi:hypothetical protein
MWADDSEWIPFLIRREAFLGEFVFDGDKMLSGAVRGG